MALSPTDIEQLYIAYFNRPAEPAGLQYWTSVDASQDAIAAAFAASQEFTQRYAGMSHREMVKAMYHSLFGRAGDAGGVAYWSGQLDRGAVKPDHVALALLRGAHGGDATVLANKAALAQEWSAGAKVLLPYVADRDIGPVSALWLEQVTDAASLHIARAALANYLATPGTSTTMISGQAQGVGYLRDATVFIDSNGDGMLGATELATRTDSNGHFLLAASSIADFPQAPASWDQHIVVTGGYDLATGRAHNGTLSLTFSQQHSGAYPATTLVRATASAMTTLRDALVRTGTAADTVDAVLTTAFGVRITPGANSLSAAFDADSGARAAPLWINAVNAEIDAVAEVVARTLQMLSARLPTDGVRHAPPKLSLDAAMRAAYDGMAGVLAAAKGGVSLESGAIALQVLNGAAALLLKGDGTIVTPPNTLSSATLDAFQQIMGDAVTQARAGIGDSAGAYATLAHITQVRAMLDELADTLPRAVAQDKAAALLPQWTEAAIKARVAAANVGDIDPYSQNDGAAIPPILDKLAVEQVHVAMLSRPAAPDALQKWMAQGDPAALATELATLPEWQGKGSDALAVNTLYTNLFGRNADASGLLYWTGVLRDLKPDLAALAQYLIIGATGSDAVTVRNKLVAAQEYSAALATPELAEAYRGNPSAGKYWMIGITDDATLKNALDLLPDFLVSNGPVPLTGVQDPAPF